jgi:ATP-dependent protease HslVU (ClpYQ) peptidase subunit
MSIVLAVQKDNNLYFAADSYSGNGNFIDGLEHYNEDKIMVKDSEKYSIIVGFAGVALLVNYFDKFVNNIQSYLVKNDHIFSNDLSEIYTEWFKDLKQSRESFAIKDDSRFEEMGVLVGIKDKTYNICSLYKILTGGYTRKVNTFAAVGVSNDMFYGMYDIVGGHNNNDQIALLSKMISISENYNCKIKMPAAVADINQCKIHYIPDASEDKSSEESISLRERLGYKEE